MNSPEELEIRGRVVTIQITALLRTEYWEESWRPEEISCLLDSIERPPADASVIYTQGVKW